MTIHNKPLRSERGIWIRVQYFNILVGACLLIMYMLCVWTFMPHVLRFFGADAEITWKHTAEALKESLYYFVIWWLLPNLALSILNMFVFGKKVCYASKSGLHFDENIIPWENIDRLTYEPATFSRTRIDFCQTHIDVLPGRTVNAVHFPLYGILVVKFFAPHAKVRLSGSGWFFVVFSLLLPILIVIFS